SPGSSRSTAGRATFRRVAPAGVAAAGALASGALACESCRRADLARVLADEFAGADMAASKWPGMAQPP
ncbi:MAG: hypothetical protein ACRDNZ_06250, partial [Streptosporangiaceae bacterium]